MTGALNFSMLSDHSNAYRHGARFYLIGLLDGREASCYADGYTIEASGAVTLWSESFLTGAGETSEGDERTPHPRENLLTIAAGAWVHVYVASVLDGSPIVIEHLMEPKK